MSPTRNQEGCLRGQGLMRYRVATILLVLALTTAAPAQRTGEGPSCAISAFIVDRDPAGLNVRSEPSGQARVFTVVSNDASGVAAIIGHRGGWFRISAIVDAESDRNLFEGDGWVHRSLLGLEVAYSDARLYASPARRSRVLARLAPQETRTTLIGCAGEWAQVRAAGRIGWLSPEGQCSNPLTTCS